MRMLTRFEGQDNEFHLGMLGFEVLRGHTSIGAPPKMGNASPEQTSKTFPCGLGPIIQKFLTLDKHILNRAGAMVGAREVFGE